ncbi:MAG: HIRAN domain-containing protein [Candidatus Atribacteria bacterium]|nr:HIRAN domain-containing protein [Candidatus Atribacteria bacterium]
MESLVIEKVGKPVQKKSLPRLKAFYPFTDIKGQLISTRAVGVSFLNRQEIVARLQMGDRIWLEMEPDNPYDHNAIKVTRENGEQFGYINRLLAADIVHYFRAYGYPVQGKVSLLTGSRWDGYSLGVVILFKLPKPKKSNNNGYNPTFDSWEDDWDF